MRDTAEVRRLKSRVREALDLLETLEQMPPGRIGSREYGWMRDTISALRSTLNRKKVTKAKK